MGITGIQFQTFDDGLIVRWSFAQFDSWTRVWALWYNVSNKVGGEIVVTPQVTCAQVRGDLQTGETRNSDYPGESDVSVHMRHGRLVTLDVSTTTSFSVTSLFAFGLWRGVVCKV